jgi:hypothetical protein
VPLGRNDDGNLGEGLEWLHRPMLEGANVIREEEIEMGNAAQSVIGNLHLQKKKNHLHTINMDTNDIAQYSSSSKDEPQCRSSSSCKKSSLNPYKK